MHCLPPAAMPPHITPTPPRGASTPPPSLHRRLRARPDTVPCYCLPASGPFPLCPPLPRPLAKLLSSLQVLSANLRKYCWHQIYCRVGGRQLRFVIVRRLASSQGIPPAPPIRAVASFSPRFWFLTEAHLPTSVTPWASSGNRRPPPSLSTFPTCPAPVHGLHGRGMP